jgi:hypothetical protein
VDDAEFRRRMDHHMTRGDELLREIKEEVALTREEVRLSREQRVRSDALMDRVNDTLDRNEKQHADLRTFLREMTVRMQRISDEQIARIERIGEAQLAKIERIGDAQIARIERIGEAQLARIERIGEAQVKESADNAAATRAHTQAILKLLDWIGGPGPGDAPGTA